MSNRDEAQPLTFDESVIVEAYKSAATASLTAADGFADKVVTAAFSIATAFGAVVALVTPKDTPSKWFVALPFAFLIGAVVLALIAQSRALELKATNDLDTIRSDVTSAVKTKRLLAVLGLGSLAAGSVCAALVLAQSYRETSKKPAATKVTLWMTAAGQAKVEQACGRKATTLAGSIADPKDLAAAEISVALTSTECPSGAGTLILPRGSFTVAKH